MQLLISTLRESKEIIVDAVHAIAERWLTNQGPETVSALEKSVNPDKRSLMPDEDTTLKRRARFASSSGTAGSSSTTVPSGTAVASALPIRDGSSAAASTAASRMPTGKQPVRPPVASRFPSLSEEAKVSGQPSSNGSMGGESSSSKPSVSLTPAPEPIPAPAPAATPAVVDINVVKAPVPSETLSRTARLAAWLHATCAIEDATQCHNYATALIDLGYDTVADLVDVEPKEWEAMVPKPGHRKKIMRNLPASGAASSSGSGSSGGASGDSGSGSSSGGGGGRLGDSGSGSGGTLSDAAEAKIAALEQQKKELADKNEQLEIQQKLHEQQEQARADAAPRLDAVMFKKAELNFRHRIQELRDSAGKGAGDKWPNFIVRRALCAPALKSTDVGQYLDIDEDSIEFKTRGGVAASKHRMVKWGAPKPDEVKGAKIIAVDDEIGGDVVIETKGTQVTFSNPSGGLVLDVLGFMLFGSKGDGFSRQDFFRPTGVTFEGEQGMDIAGAGGLSQDMHASFWLGVMHEDMGLFDVSDTALPRQPSEHADRQRLVCVGQFLAKSIIDEKPIGRGFCRFLLEFLIDDTSRSFDTSKPIDQQARDALSALQNFDAELARQYGEVLHGDLVEGAFTIGHFVPSHDDADLPVTKQNRAEVIVLGCKYLLWDKREDALLALRTGFSTREVCSRQPIELLVPLQAFYTADLQLLVQGQDMGVSTADLISSIEWPREGTVSIYEAGFPHQSKTPALLREIMEDNEVFNTQRRADFIQWATARHILPVGGLDATPNGKIKLRCNKDAPNGCDEAKWGLPIVKTCVAELWLRSFTSRKVLQEKLLLAIDHSGDGFTRGD